MCCSPVVHEHILESQPRPIHLPSPPTPRHLTHRSQPSQVQSTHLSPSHPTRKEKRKKEKEEKREKEKGKKKKGRRKTFLRRGFLFRSPIYKDARAFKSFLRAFPLPPRLAFITKKTPRFSRAVRTLRTLFLILLWDSQAVRPFACTRPKAALGCKLAEKGFEL